MGVSDRVQYQLVQRRSDLKQMLVAEKNRLKAPSTLLVHQSCLFVIQTLEEQINLISQQIQEMIDQDSVLKEKKKILKTIPGIGDIIASELLILLPELGYLQDARLHLWRVLRQELMIVVDIKGIGKLAMGDATKTVKLGTKSSRMKI